jgi:hypothetical protein
MEGAEMEVGAGGLPPPTPVPEGAVPTKAPGYGGGNGSTGAAGPSHSGPNGGPNGGGNGAGPNGGGGPIEGSGGAALAALALLPKVPVPAKATRPDYGRTGRPIQLCVNYFRAKLVKAEDVYHYNVRFTHLLNVYDMAFGLSIVLCLGLASLQLINRVL